MPTGRKRVRRKYKSKFASEVWQAREPLLAAALREARRRFANLPGVIGFGLGRKFSEKHNRYAPLSSSSKGSGLCVKVVVKKKRAKGTLPLSQRIRSFIYVKGAGGSQRIPIDVVSAGQPCFQAAFKHVWPTAGEMNVGRLFSCGYRPPTKASGNYKGGEAALGTVGGLVQLSDGDVVAMTAGHVFCDCCNGIFAAPQGTRSFGSSGTKWVRFGSPLFKPNSIRPNILVTDAMAFVVPPSLMPANGAWPTLFDGKLATDEDSHAAVLDGNINGFIWVDRANQIDRVLPIDLQESLDGFDTDACRIGKVFRYSFIWRYRFMSPNTTVHGDSGAPLFVQSESHAHHRLLGFHFLYDDQLKIGYAVDAQFFMSSALNALPGDGCDFY